MTTILDLDADDARRHLLTSSSYCSIPLPTYFDFNHILKKVSDYLDTENSRLSNKTNSGSEKKNTVRKVESPNHIIYANKDGQYAWRPLTLINPVLYVKLVHTLTEEANWQAIGKRFHVLRKDPRVECFSIPQIPSDGHSEVEAAIENYVNHFEQRSIELSAKYEYMASTDITDCYGSIYTHTVAWALHEKDKAKAKRRDDALIGNQIDAILQDMNHGQTNGIPQGNTASDLIAELILAYGDDLLLERFTTKKSNDANPDPNDTDPDPNDTDPDPNDTDPDWKILRYRDDFRIFAHSKEQAHNLLHELTTVLQGLNMRLNADKTHISSDVLTRSIKQDKAALISSNIPPSLHQQGIRNQLISIRQFALEYPNSGSLKRLLGDFRRHVEVTKEKDRSYSALAAYPIVLDIALRNPSTYPFCMSIISVFLSDMTPEERTESIETIETRMRSTPNIGILELWLQRLCSPRAAPSREYSETLCKHCPSRDSHNSLWDTSWLSDDLRRIVAETPIVDPLKYYSLQEIIDRSETSLFEFQYPE